MLHAPFIKKNIDCFLFLFSSKSHLNGSTPDYSKVKPRVNFPKVIYKPPNSRLCSKNESLSFRPPTGCKSSVESVNEVGLNISDVPPATSDSTGECQELGSPQEATRLLRELEVRFQSRSIINIEGFLSLLFFAFILSCLTA